MLRTPLGRPFTCAFKHRVAASPLTQTSLFRHTCQPQQQQKKQQQQQQHHRQLLDRRNSHAAASSSCSQSEAEGGFPTSAYVHLPFCKRRCFYCDFPVSVVGSKPEQPGVQQGMHEYVNLLCKEISATVNLNGPPLKTVFFGGGTPTLIPPKMLQQLMDALSSKYGIAAEAEVSMESDPGTFDVPRLQQYMSLGVNRFSMGVQCFQQELLQLCGRSHTLEDIYRAIDDFHQAGVQNWSLDLISGLPQLTIEHWQHSLREAIKADPSHISVYDLQVSSFCSCLFPIADNGCPVLCGIAIDPLKRQVNRNHWSQFLLSCYHFIPSLFTHSNQAASMLLRVPAASRHMVLAGNCQQQPCHNKVHSKHIDLPSSRVQSWPLFKPVMLIACVAPVITMWTG